MKTCCRLLVLMVLLGCEAPEPPAPPWLNAGTDTQAQLRAPSPAEGFTVAIIGDRTNGEEAGLAVLEQAVVEINLLQPDLVLHIGDIVPGYIRDMAQWEAEIARAKAILGRLDAPFFPVPGNHDVITGSGDTEDHRGEELHKAHFGPLYYSLDYADAHFVCLYTDEQLQSRPHLSRRQVEWLRADLAATSARHIFVVMHKPLWDYKDSGWDEVHDILRQRPVRAVFAGHYHHYYKAQLRDGIQYYVLGVTGGQIYSPELAGGLEHYSLLRVRPDGCRLTLIKPGHVLPDDHVGLADFEAMETLRFLPERETGVMGAIDSPDGGAVDTQVRVRVRNPLDRPMEVALRGLGRDSDWDFGGESPTATVEAGAVAEMSLPIRSGPVDSSRLVPPDVEIAYAHVDTRGRPVPIVLRRRVPLQRQAKLALATPQVVLDGRATKDEWALAQPLRAAVWQASAYETGQPEPIISLLAAADGLYVCIEARDDHVSGFRGKQVLGDAVFVAAIDASADRGKRADRPPVVALFPFGGEPKAVCAPWNEKRIEGPAAPGVQVAAAAPEDAGAWTCEAFVPWQTLLGSSALPDTLRVNAGVWDNDGDLFTELHSWAPMADPALWGTLEVSVP